MFLLCINTEQTGRMSVRKGEEVTDLEIRKTVFKHKLLYKDIAARIGISAETMSRWINVKMTDWQRELVIETIADMVAEKQE